MPEAPPRVMERDKDKVEKMQNLSRLSVEIFRVAVGARLWMPGRPLEHSLNYPSNLCLLYAGVSNPAGVRHGSTYFTFALPGCLTLASIRKPSQYVSDFVNRFQFI